MRLPNSVGSFSHCVLHRNPRYLFSRLLLEHLTYSYRIFFLWNVITASHSSAVIPSFTLPPDWTLFFHIPLFSLESDMCTVFNGFTQRFMSYEDNRHLFWHAKIVPSEKLTFNMLMFDSTKFLQEKKKGSRAVHCLRNISDGSWIKMLHFLVRCIIPWGISENRFTSKRTHYLRHFSFPLFFVFSFNLSLTLFPGEEAGLMIFAYWWRENPY